MRFATKRPLVATVASLSSRKRVAELTFALLFPQRGNHYLLRVEKLQSLVFAEVRVKLEEHSKQL